MDIFYFSKNFFLIRTKKFKKEEKSKQVIEV